MANISLSCRHNHVTCFRFHKKYIWDNIAQQHTMNFWRNIHSDLERIPSKELSPNKRLKCCPQQQLHVGRISLFHAEITIQHVPAFTINLLEKRAWLTYYELLGKTLCPCGEKILCFKHYLNLYRVFLYKISNNWNNQLTRRTNLGLWLSEEILVRRLCSRTMANLISWSKIQLN